MCAAIAITFSRSFRDAFITAAPPTDADRLAPVP
jgi:hypothetical protein